MMTQAAQGSQIFRSSHTDAAILPICSFDFLLLKFVRPFGYRLRRSSQLCRMLHRVGRSAVEIKRVGGAIHYFRRGSQLFYKVVARHFVPFSGVSSVCVIHVSNSHRDGSRCVWREFDSRPSPHSITV